MIVNLNTVCKVQLNDIGKIIWLSQLDAIPEDTLNRDQIIAHIENSIDEDNCVSADLWMIMNVFGQYISPTSMPFTRTTIELNKNPTGLTLIAAPFPKLLYGS